MDYRYNLVMKNLEGKDFNYWHVISYAGKKKYRDCWLCRCICGVERVVQERTLLNDGTFSCGCVTQAKRRLDLTGKKFARLTVTSFAYVKNKRTYWNCVCDCGKEIILMGKNLTNGNTKSCGCINHNQGQMRKNLIGKKFGDLTVTDWAGVVDSKSMWKCQCTCGNTTIVQGYTLEHGYTRSCGCKHYPVTDTKILAQKFHKHTSTITLAKRQLFNGAQVLTQEQVRQLDDYFKQIKNKGFSKGEKELLSFVESIYKGKVLANDRNVIAPKELDVYIPEKNLAIEYNGLYWHSEAGNCFQMYHWHKTKACIDKGIRLVQFYDVEWHNQQEICKSMIRSALGVYERREYARNCVVMEIWDKQTVIDFFNENHIQGAVHKFSCALGLYKGDELLQAVVFGKQHFGRNGDYELYRMVTKKNTQVLGGFSRLMKYCPYDTVVSYVDLRLFDAKGYLAGGWKIEKRANPTFCITDGLNRFSRHEFKKSECLKRFDNVTEDMTESEMQIANGFYRVWNSGTYRVRWTRG